ncbi:MAG: hypothetical protein LAP87_29905 [Acidobacteriia bacterium]|nr:hypothetical protein [Terriglobia bacterium]
MPEAERRVARNSTDSLCVVGAEALFIVLPFVVIAIVLLQKGELSKIAYMPEWAIAAAVLTGLSLVRFTTGLLHANPEVETFAWERVMLIFSLIVILALVPSLLILALVLVSGVNSEYLAVAQIFLFLLSLSLFMTLGWTGQYILAQEKAAEPSPPREIAVISSRAAGD